MNEWWHLAAIELMEYVRLAIFPDHWNLGRINNEHLRQMIYKIIAPDFEREKGITWLGWIEGVLEATGNMTAEQSAAINKKAKKLSRTLRGSNENSNRI